MSNKVLRLGDIIPSAYGDERCFKVCSIDRGIKETRKCAACSTYVFHLVDDRSPLHPNKWLCGRCVVQNYDYPDDIYCPFKFWQRASCNNDCMKGWYPKHDKVWLKQVCPPHEYTVKSTRMDLKSDFVITETCIVCGHVNKVTWDKANCEQKDRASAIEL